MNAYAQRSRVFRWGLAVLLALLVVTSCTTDPPDVPPELAQAIAQALPDLQRYELVTLDDAPMVAELRDLATSGDGTSITLQLPVFAADGRVATGAWIAHHVNVRELLIDVAGNEFVDFPAEDVSGPSMTFRGFPDWSFEQTMDVLARAEAGTLEPDLIQPSVLNLIGDRLEGAHFGDADHPYVTVLDALDNALALQFGTDEAERLAALTPANYLVYRQQDLRPTLLHGEQPYLLDAVANDAAEVASAIDAVVPHAHTLLKVLRPVMVADDTIYDPFFGMWLINDWFARVDAAANRQNAFLWLANIAPDVPSQFSTLPTNNNRILVKTQIAGYRVLTESGWAANFNKPTTGCGDAGTYVDRLRSLSAKRTDFANEYWMWWTRQFGGGCAYIGTLGRTPFDGAVGWSGYGNGTVDWTSYVFMHESGHILGATHVTGDGTSPETVPSHRCRLLGVIAFGGTGPSLMSYAEGTPTFCFAATPSSGTPKRNLTKVAEYLNGALR